MKAEELIDKILKERLVVDEKGNSRPLHSNIDLEEGDFLKKIIKGYKPKSSIEVGCAYGMSSLFICSELEKNETRHHTIVDPGQSTQWENIGVTNLKRAGIDFFEILEKPSEIALPQLYSEGKKYDFAFIDGWHTFDHTLIDFFYLSKMLNINGVIVIDDVNFPSINKLMRYLLSYPAYIQVGHVKVKHSNKRVFFDSVIKAPFRLFSKLLPPKIKHEIFAGSIIKSNKKLNLDSSMVALQKISNDDRGWDWWKDF